MHKSPADSCFIFGTVWLSGERRFTLFQNTMPVTNDQRVSHLLTNTSALTLSLCDAFTAATLQELAVCV